MLDTIIKDTMENALNGEGIQESVDKYCKEAIDRVVRDAFNYNSEFQKQLKSKIESVMPTVDATDLSSFADAVRNMVQKSLVTLADDKAKETINGMMDQLCPSESVIKLDDLETAFKEKRAWDSGSDIDVDHEYFDETVEYTWEVEAPNDDGHFDIYCSDKSNSGRFSDETTVMRFKTGEDGLDQCWLVRSGDIELKPGHLFQMPLYGFDAMVFRLYTKSAKLKTK